MSDAKKTIKWIFRHFRKQKRAQGADMLRAKQFEVAMSGNISMLIWLGKQRLGQADKQEIKTKEIPASLSQPEAYFDSIEQYSRRAVEVDYLESQGVAFDPDNPDHIAKLRNFIGGVVKAQVRIYPDAREQLEGWEEYFDKENPGNGPGMKEAQKK